MNGYSWSADQRPLDVRLGRKILQGMAQSSSGRGLHADKDYSEGPPDRFSDPLETLALCFTRLGSGFFGRAAT